MSKRGNPFREIDRMLEELRRQFESSTRELEGETPFAGELMGGGSMNVDLVDEGDRLVVTADLPGFEKDDIDVRLAEGSLRIRADREDERASEDGEFVRRERTRQSLSRSVSLPEPVATEEVSATHRNGVLTVTLPKTNPDEGGHRIDVE